MRQYIIDEITRNNEYRDSDGNPQYTTTIGYLTSLEKEFIQTEMKFVIKPVLNTSYNLIIFNN